MLDYVDALRSESARFSDLTRSVDPAAPVPSCPGWSAADLLWHLAEVQHFWATIVEGLLASPESIPELTRPGEESLGDLFASQSSRLVAALTGRSSTDECWSWHDTGHNVGWVRRRQAHEALIHRVDAELTAGNDPVVGEALAADGVDEVLSTFLDAGDLPEWAGFFPDGSSGRIVLDGFDSWSFVLGHFRGTSPNTGKRYDEPALRLEDVANPTITIAGIASDMDLWLWGRAPADPLSIAGDRSVADQVRRAAAAGTQ